jgi:DNA uptake protein ComE-like DNA-binding protein
MNEHVDDDLWVPDRLRGVGRRGNGGGTDARGDEAPGAEGERAVRAEARARQVESLLRDAELRIERLEASLRGKRDEAGRLELNTASVEGLRGIGLSITQAARLVASREARGGFASLDEIDAVPGLPPEQRADLRERAYVEAAAA